MSDLTPAQRLRVAAALSEGPQKLQISREDALRLARAWEEGERALATLAAVNFLRQRRLEKIEQWSVRTVLAVGLMQSVAMWVLT